MSQSDLSADQPLSERLSTLRCGVCNWPIGRANLQQPAEIALQCHNCRKTSDGKALRVINVTRVVVVDRHP